MKHLTARTLFLLFSALLCGVAVLFATTGCGGRDRIPLSGVLPPTIRVQLGDPRESAVLAVADGWDALSIGGREWHDRGTTIETPILAGASGIVFHGAATGSTLLRIHPTNAFTLTVGPARIAYRGDLLVRQQGGRLQFVGELDLETYVAGVIVNEIGGGAAAGAYRAQAVVARSYAYARWRAQPEAPFHLYDDQNSQVYRGITVATNAGVTFSDLEKRTTETRGVILTWKSEPFPTYYFSTCGGHTTEAATSSLDPGGATEPLRGVPCAYCGPSKYFAWTEEVPIQRILDALKPRGVVAPITSIEWSKIGHGDWVAEVAVTYGPKGARKLVPGLEFRRAAGLRSMRIESVTALATSLVFKGSGWGHGVGMCQVGCQEMAKKGFDETQILRYYYPGAEFTRVY